MSFYKELSSVYDMVFPEDKVTTEFLCKDLLKGSTVIDLACGTGTYSIPIANRGHNVIGIDLDQSMIKIAKEKKVKVKTEFQELDMLKIKTLVTDESVDMFFCIGNSLVHIQNTKKIQNFIMDIYSKLKIGGQFIIQIINYDRILKQSVKSLPRIINEENKIEFIRNYNLDNITNKINFETELIINAEKVYKNSVSLIPVKSKELLKIITEAGFYKVKFYGDFSEKEFSEDAYTLVIRAIK